MNEVSLNSTTARPSIQGARVFAGGPPCGACAAFSTTCPPFLGDMEFMPPPQEATLVIDCHTRELLG
ncbi:hypothetical protein PBR20603_04505 [Pandoraea bronchicola]|uniref:Uncharacterized protein n=1 Tax=Pandoraea bronchicola TaxID=2508287 RepID=A0A5E5C1L3_9BURK|nr:hypothetical protein PBR20603_04505 [Pandoraea bronchicola]